MFRLPAGLGALAPGPIDWLNLGRPGVGGVKFVEFCEPLLRPELGVIG